MALTRPLFQTIVRALTPHFVDSEKRRLFLNFAFYDDDALRAACPPTDGAQNAREFTQRLVTVLDREQPETWRGELSLLVLLQELAKELRGDPARELARLADRLRRHAAAEATARAAGLEPDRATLDELITHYLDEMRAEFEELAREYVDLAAGETRRDTPRRREGRAAWLDPLAGLEEMLVELDGAQQMDDTDRTTLVDNVREALLRVPRGVLLGEPGSGKSWTLWRLALEYIAIWQGTRDDPVAGRPPLIPVPIRLQAFRGGTTEQPETFNEHVHAQLGLLAPHLPRLQREQRLIFLLDALNEMPRRGPRGADLLAEVRRFLRSAPHFLVSCRVRDYQQDLDTLRPLAQLTLRPLTPPQIKQVVHLRLGAARGAALWEAMGGGPDLLGFWRKVVDKLEPERFWRADVSVPPYTSYDEDAAWRRMHRGARLMLLCRNPFMAFLLCRIYQSRRGELPRSRAALFGRFVAVLLAREADLAQKRGEPWPEGRAAEIEGALVDVARAMQAARGTVLPRRDALATLDNHAVLLEAALSANLLVDSGEELRFTHQLLQEYFAARVLLKAMEGGESGDRFFGKEWWNPGIWRETVIMLGEFLGEQAMGPNRVARWLASTSPEVALEVILRNGAALTLDDVEPATRRALEAAARTKRESPHPYGRAAAYRVLAILRADDRPGIGVNEHGVPKIEWISLARGVFPIGGDEGAWNPLKVMEETPLAAFKMAKYPVTNWQWQAFLDDDEGYEDERWWRGLTDERPQPAQPSWEYGNHPRETVNWYEAVAFCRWLTWKLGLDPKREEVRLPTEVEWERAARGEEGRIYPWGEDEYESGYANINETWGNEGPYNLDQTSAVGIYPYGDTPDGICDLSGNVWEWTASKYEEGEVYITLRGGSWYFSPQAARAASRDGYLPLNRVRFYGFRVVCGPPLPH